MTIIIVTCSRERLLRRTIQSILKSDRPESLREIIVAEIGESSDAAGVLEGFSGELPIKRVRLESRSKCNALNHALEAAEDDFILFFDDDVEVAPGTIRLFSEAAEKFGPGHYFGGSITCEFESPLPSWLEEFVPPGYQPFRPLSEDGEHSTFIGMNWAAFKRDLDEAGRFNVKIGPGSDSGINGDETLMMRCLRGVGCKGRFLAEAEVKHFVSSASTVPSWSLKRAYIEGMERAILDEGNEDTVTVFGVPRWVLRQMIINFFTSILAKCSSDPARRFRPAYELSFFKGYLAGWISVLRGTIT